jgi:IMP dehydrogenase
MAKLKTTYTYRFDDVNLIPSSESKIRSRRDVDTSREILSGVKLQTPMIASPMATVCEGDLALAASRAGAIGCIHRFNTISNQVNQVLLTQLHSDKPHMVLGAVGTSDDTMDRVAALLESNVDGIVIDVAFLNNTKTIETIRTVREKYGDAVKLISGNVCTGSGFYAGCEAGLDAIRVGIGNGGNCRTSRVTGVGRGIISALIEAKLAQQKFLEDKNKYVYIWADGGINIGADFCKALAAGADGVIMGRQFAATFESPAQWCDEYGVEWEIEDKKEIVERMKAGDAFKEYMGSASFEAQFAMGKEKKDIITSEGVQSVLKVYGSVEDIVTRFNGALRSAMSYLGTMSLDEFQYQSTFELVTAGTLKQQKARGLSVTEITI